MKSNLRLSLKRLFWGLFLVAKSLGAVAPAPAANTAPADRRTVFVLIDESGTLKADAAGWRKQAAAMLAYALTDGSSMAMSGFGNAGRTLDLAPRYLDSSPDGIRNRMHLAELATALTDNDRQTDLFDAIRQALTEVSKMDTAVRQAAPPAIIVLSDFQPDPAPNEATRAQLCQDLRNSSSDLLLVGFGKVDTRVAEYLASCAGTTAWGAVGGPRALLDVFWKIHRRYTSSLRVYQRRLDGQSRFAVPVPPWSGELFLLASSDDPAKTVNQWQWSVLDARHQYEGRYYRLARLTPSPELLRKGVLDVGLENSSNIVLSVAASGQLALKTVMQPPAPWLIGESVIFRQELVSSKTGKPVAEWTNSGDVEYASSVDLSAGNHVPLRWEHETSSFEGTLIVPAEERLTGRAKLTIDGASWSQNISGTASSSPVDLGLDNQGRMVFQTWGPGWPASKVIRSILPNRRFKATIAMAGFDAGISALEFDSGTQLHRMSIEPPASVDFSERLFAFFRPLRPLTGAVKVATQFETGQTVESQAIPVVILFYPLWVRASIVIVVAGPIVFFALFLLIGRRLPPWHLVPCDDGGKPLRGRNPIRLANYRRSLSLDRHGVPGVAIKRSLFGATWVRLRGPVSLRTATGVSLDGHSNHRIAVGDILLYKAGGNTTSYRVDAF